MSFFIRGGTDLMSIGDAWQVGKRGRNRDDETAPPIKETSRLKEDEKFPSHSTSKEHFALQNRRNLCLHETL